MNKLAKFLSESGTTQSDFAAQVCVTQGMVSRLVKGVAKPGLDLAVKIERLTCGEVPAKSWVPVEETPTPTREDDAA